MNDDAQLAASGVARSAINALGDAANLDDRKARAALLDALDAVPRKRVDVWQRQSGSWRRSAEAWRIRAEDAEDEAARLRDQLLAEQDNAQRRIDELQAEAARLREAIEQHREDVAVFEGSEEDDAWSWHQALWAALDAEDKENQDGIGRREKKG